MVGRVEMKVIAPSFTDMAMLAAVTSRAADVIYTKYPHGA